LATSFAVIDSRPAVFLSARAAVVGHNGGDLASRGPPAGIHHDEQLHQVIVHRSTGGLDEKHITAADRFLDLDVKLAVGESLDYPRTIRDAKVGADFSGQLRVGSAAEQP